MADFTTFIGPATRPEPRPDPGTIGPPRSDYVQPKHEQVMTGAALSALASTNPVTAFPMAAKLGHDLALDGPAAFSDPSNVAALAGIMTYGASSVRMGANRAKMQRMAARGEPLPKIRRVTGYEPGPFGMGAETRGDATLRPQAVFRPQGTSGTLGELGFVHPDLERAYPGIARTPVHIVPDGRWADTVAKARSRMSEWSRGDTSTGFTSADGIFIRGKMPGETVPEYVNRSDGSLVHELQHIAQTRDGLRPPRVHATREDYLRDAREVDARNSAERRDYLPQERELIPRRVTQDVASEDVRQLRKGGKTHG